MADTETILTENARDVAKAKDNGISEIMVDRLRLNKDRIQAIANGIYSGSRFGRSDWSSC